MDESTHQWHNQSASAAVRSKGPPPAPRKSKAVSSRLGSRALPSPPPPPSPKYIVFCDALPSSVAVGSHIKTEKEEELGRGSYGVTYRVSVGDGVGELALKEQVMAADLLGYKQLHIFHYIKTRVCQVTNLASSPVSLVSCKRVWWADDKLHTLMSLCPGVSARTHVERHGHEAFTEAYAWQLLVDVCRALAHLHTHELLFNDVKPDNIQMHLNVDEKKKKTSVSFTLVDLDSITCMKADAPAMHDDRTGGYEAPEALNDRGVPASDTFSLGVSVRQLTRKRSDALESLLTVMCAQNYQERPSLARVIELAQAHLA
jgi:serine/threonine protein kinase